MKFQLINTRSPWHWFIVVVFIFGLGSYFWTNAGIGKEEREQKHITYINKNWTSLQKDSVGNQLLPAGPVGTIKAFNFLESKWTVYKGKIVLVGYENVSSEGASVFVLDNRKAIRLGTFTDSSQWKSFLTTNQHLGIALSEETYVINSEATDEHWIITKDSPLFDWLTK